ncbi:integrase core domain protein [Peptoanaerobacter stomatis]|uniref:Integrase core domain protein n=1 Tax=Peptoanaerobacter stomatis TaxID=796937 RepID=J5WF50_9FIRM|nr:Mu transposase C-terminal domain-containing protein [Peptoanaerobacter stomatis]EJU21512.1 integrase core domain protein [Peptoanaerobacter stomatis]
MEYLSVKEVAELKGCTERYIRLLTKNGKLSADIKQNPSNNLKEYIFNIDNLPDDLKIRYYKNINKDKQIFKDKRGDCNVSGNEKNDEKDIVCMDKGNKKIKYGRGREIEKKSYSSFSESERDEIDNWIEIIKYWIDCRGIYKNKAIADRDIIGSINMKLKQSGKDMRVTATTLYRKYDYYKNNDLEGLVDKRGGHNRGKSSIPSEIWNAFLFYYLDDKRPTLSDTYKTVIDWTCEFYPQFLHIIPSEMTFRRHLKEDIPDAVVTYMRYGEKAVKDKCLPYIERLYDDLKVNDVWVTDNHTLDIQSGYDDRDGFHRLYITAFFEAKSGIIAGWNITDNPSINSTIFALRHGIKRTGTVPKVIYSDNGSEFMSYDFGGRGRRSKSSKREMDYSMTILGRLGIELKIAQVRNARAKPVERFFLDFKNHISKMISTYTGGNVTERPESLKKRIKNGEIPYDSHIRGIIDEMVELENAALYGGSESRYRRLTKTEVYNRCVNDTVAVKIGDDELNLMLMRTETVQKVKRKGVKIRIAGEDIWYSSDDMWMMFNKEVYVRYDPTNLSTARIYDKDDRYIATWEVERTLMLAFMENDVDALADANEKLAKITKSVKAYAKDMFANMSSETKIDMLDVKLRKMHALKAEGKLVLDESNVMSIRGNKENIESSIKKTGTDDSAVIIDINRMNANIEKRK